MTKPITDPAAYGTLPADAKTTDSSVHHFSHEFWEKAVRVITVMALRLEAGERDKLISTFRTITWNPTENRIYESIYNRPEEEFFEMGEIPLVHIYIPYGTNDIVIVTAVPDEADMLLEQVQTMITWDIIPDTGKV